MKKTKKSENKTPAQSISRGNFLFRLFAGSAITACTMCALSATPIPGTRPGARPQGNGCCKHRHCRYYRGGPKAD